MAWGLADVSLGAFLDDRGDDVDRVLTGIHSLCAFGPVFMTVADELGYLRDHEVTAPFLLLWSGGGRADRGSAGCGNGRGTGARLLTEILTLTTALTDSGAPEWGRAGFRAYERALDGLLDP
ncbi:hypothetical protein [Streptomyces cupreus]|uniref:Uncharacterized protein n=1 Tax=Streptomyces cupreus TaxID=2759956 RepID=A0A7X1JAL8_9ACTN|nr:hypothetical protein [Streptomyces cupreus]MBC2907256.1 hypothetical protein [Streptomyces cupreus]